MKIAPPVCPQILSKIRKKCTPNIQKIPELSSLTCRFWKQLNPHGPITAVRLRDATSPSSSRQAPTVPVSSVRERKSRGIVSPSK